MLIKKYFWEYTRVYTFLSFHSSIRKTKTDGFWMVTLVTLLFILFTTHDKLHVNTVLFMF